MDDKKINMLVEILKNVTYSDWRRIENEIDTLYLEKANKEVPNDELGTLRNRLTNMSFNI